MVEVAAVINLDGLLGGTGVADALTAHDAGPPRDDLSWAQTGDHHRTNGTDGTDGQGDDRAGRDDDDQGDDQGPPDPVDLLPDGFDLWLPGSRPPRPIPDPGVFYGPIGRFALEAAKHTEADPIAIFAQALVLYGLTANRSAYMLAGNDRHSASLFALMVGASNKGGKGTSWAVVLQLLELVAPGLRARVMSGFASGESIIDAVAPPDDDKAQDSPPDNRLLWFESEFGAVLSRNMRDGATSSTVMRDMWDGRPVQARSRTHGTKVGDGYHLAVLGHITREELRAKLTQTDVFSGFANRFLYFYVQRGAPKPFGGNVPEHVIKKTAQELTASLKEIRGGGQMTRTAGADELWEQLYYDLYDDDPAGLLGQAISRGAPQCLRLAITLALADGQRAINEEHVGAAYLIWQYSRASAAAIFDDTTGNADADRLLDALRLAGADGLDGRQVDSVMGKKPARAKAARQVLEERQLARTVTVPPGRQGGRPRDVTFAVTTRRAVTSEVAG